MTHSTNRILTALPSAEFAVLQSVLKSKALKVHDVLFNPRQSIETVYFPIDGVISLVVPLSTGELIETAMVGRDGAVGAHAVFDGPIALNRAVVQVDGKALSCSVAALKRLMAECPVLFRLLQRHEQALFGQAQQSAACNVAHTLESRLSRWLLRAHDLAGRDELPLTQEYLAEMLGVRRTSVSLVAHTLQQAGFIKYRRGRITILNRDALNETACECYEAVKLGYDALEHSTNG